MAGFCLLYVRNGKNHTLTANEARHLSPKYLPENIFEILQIQIKSEWVNNLCSTHYLRGFI